MTERIEDFKPRTCLTCRHLIIGGAGRMVDGLPETEFQTFSCALMEGEIKEYFSAPMPKSEYSKSRTECPHWAERT